MTDFERHLIESLHTWALPRTPGSRLIAEDGWLQVISDDFKSPSFNEVLLSQVSASEFEDRIDYTVRTYSEIGTDFKWCIHPHSRPLNSTDLLLKLGFTSWQSRMMCVRPKEFRIGTHSSSIEVQKVPLEDMDHFLDLFLKCWNIAPQDHRSMRDQLLFDHREGNSCFERFIAFANGQPAGVASLVRNRECGYLHATAVLPEFQGKGVYRALVEKRMAVLKEADVDLAVSGARERTSAPRLQKMGFRDAWPLQMFLKKVGSRPA